MFAILWENVLRIKRVQPLGKRICRLFSDNPAFCSGFDSNERKRRHFFHRQKSYRSNEKILICRCEIKDQTENAQLADFKLTFSPNILFQPSANSGVAKIRSTISGTGI